MAFKTSIEAESGVKMIKLAHDKKREEINDPLQVQKLIDTKVNESYERFFQLLAHFTYLELKDKRKNQIVLVIS